jgi:hypothetical protein
MMGRLAGLNGRSRRAGLFPIARSHAIPKRGRAIAGCGVCPGKAIHETGLIRVRFRSIARLAVTGVAALAMAGMAFTPVQASTSPSMAQEARTTTALAGVGASAPAKPVQQRGKECGWTGCSEIQNRADYRVWVARDWCGEPDTGDVCGDSPKQRLWPGEHSYEDAYEDTDAFAVGAGCVMKVQMNADGQEDAPIRKIDRKGKSTKYYKVSNDQDIDIEDYDC